SIVVGLVFTAEASLLVARIWWATYFTIFLTLLGIPLELIEIWRRPRQFRGWVFLVVNLAILIFLWKRRNEFREGFSEAEVEPEAETASAPAEAPTPSVERPRPGIAP